MTRDQMIEAARVAYNGGVSRYLYNQFGALNQPDMERAGMTAAFDAIAGTLIEQGRQMGRRDVVAVPDDLARVILQIGKAEWGTTEAHNADGHAAHIAESVRITEQHFGQEGPQMMHGLYIEGTSTVICHTGTSPNSPQIARALTGAWNRLVDEARAALGDTK